MCEEVFADMLSYRASLYNGENTTDMLVVMRTDEHVFQMHKCFVGFLSKKLFVKLSKDKDEIEKDVLHFFYTGKIVGYEEKSNKLREFAFEYNIPLFR